VSTEFDFYEYAQSGEDVDRITAQRINELHGSPRDELKNLRKGQLAIMCLMRPDIFPKERHKEILDYGDKLIVMNQKIERLIAEGKAYKKVRGW
jgi:hypothetical protein